MNRTIIGIIVFGALACDDGATTDAQASPDQLGIAVSELSKWEMTECPTGLEEVEGFCVAGTVDLQLEIDDCRTVEKCLPEGFHTCAQSVVGGVIDATSADAGFVDYRLPTPSAYNKSAAYAAYLTAKGQSAGFEGTGSFREEFDADGTSECLIAAEGDIILDHWKWSKFR